MIEAKYYRKLDDGKVCCELCPHHCHLRPAECGICGARKNIAGRLYTLNYARTVTISIDPMEKKPLYHFYPGERILSIGSNSCNFSCDFCQNYSISQLQSETRELTPGSLLALTEQHLCRFVAYTYTEPATWFEYVLDSARLLKENGIGTVMVTNGYINREPLLELLPYIDAMNIDLKALDNEFYTRLCRGTLRPVMEVIATAAASCLVELTNLLIPGENDSDDQIEKLVDFVASINPEIPLHFSKYYPHYKMTNPPTPERTLYRAKEIAEKKLAYVYLGNIVTNSDTHCPQCGALLVERGYRTRVRIQEGCCPACQHKIYGAF